MPRILGLPGDVPDPEAFKRSGFFLAADQERVGLADFARDPPAHPLGSPSGKVEISSEAWARDTGGSAIPTWTDAAASFPVSLLLLSPKVGHRTHSQGGDPETVARSGGHFLEMNPADAAERGLRDGDDALISNPTGRTKARVRITDRLMAGVVSLPEGIWLPTGDGDPGSSGSPNLLTSTLDHGPAGAASMHGISVRVGKGRGP